MTLYKRIVNKTDKEGKERTYCNYYLELETGIRVPIDVHALPKKDVNGNYCANPDYAVYRKFLSLYSLPLPEVTKVGEENK